MKHYVMALTLTAALFVSPAAAQVIESTGAGQPKGSCLATERATRNSKGGDRDQGGFGPAQNTFTAQFEEGYVWPVNGKTYYDYGQWLKDWRAKYC